MFVPLPPGLESLCIARTLALAAAQKGESCSMRDVPYPPGPCSQAARPSPGDIFLAVSRGDQAFAQGYATMNSTLSPPTSPSYGSPLDTPLHGPSKEEPLHGEGADLLPWEDCDEAEVEKALEPILRDILGSDALRTKGKGQAANASVRWWTRPHLPLLCPLTRFPICLLPYPPFKLRIDPKRSSPHRLVDGKFLAMHIIVTSRYNACGRDLQASDITALDDYVHRCKLGPYRPGRAAELAKEAATAETPELRAKATQELERFVGAARVELGKLRRIQENRLLQINKALPPHLTSGRATRAAACPKIPSNVSEASTIASTSSGRPTPRGPGSGRSSLCA